MEDLSGKILKLVTMKVYPSTITIYSNNNESKHLIRPSCHNGRKKGGLDLVCQRVLSLSYVLCSQNNHNLLLVIIVFTYSSLFLQVVDISFWNKSLSVWTKLSIRVTTCKNLLYRKSWTISHSIYWQCPVQLIAFLTSGHWMIQICIHVHFYGFTLENGDLV